MSYLNFVIFLLIDAMMVYEGEGYCILHGDSALRSSEGEGCHITGP